MPDVVTHFTNNLKNADRVRYRLKPKAFIHQQFMQMKITLRMYRKIGRKY
jgi:hypothetical protein